MTKLRELLDRYKYPLLMLVIGAALMLSPGGGGGASGLGGTDTDALLTQALSHTRGVGEALVIVSESGVVVVCGGADNAGVRLDIIRAVQSYTGFTADKITVLKMAEQS